MTIDNIIETRGVLDAALRKALSTMEKKDEVMRLRQCIADNQAACPHTSTEYSWAPIDGKCPYCGKKLESD